MKPIDCLNVAVQSVQKMDLPKSFKNEILADLNYFKQQAVLQISSRDHQSIIRDRWVTHVNKTKGTKIYEFLQKDDILWRTLQCFGFANEPASYILPKIERTNPPVERYSSMDTEAFFIYLGNEIMNSKQLLGKRFLEIYLGVKYLQSEARHSRGKRATKEIIKVAQWLRPILWQLKIMADFEKEKSLQEKINFFLNDGLQTRFDLFQP